ncbi:hypothetical protein PRIPAC_75114 [Pristionchus pacificus]|uniref:Uncharacterized protein n=1 Tax=Pristionchus pacificus TaxID=54126 RepID=A0A2A6CSW7_PRIPA|nr:hypothetical protein PRIPAC_75114 [Pristionchus pacificus]|eukprot:PDM81198.1 hypothetical protein PRIPAC_36201 [Pristionchus pacificus]
METIAQIITMRFLILLLVSVSLASAHLAQLLGMGGWGQPQCPPCICNNIATQSQSQAQAQNQQGGGGWGGPRWG